MSYSTFLLIFMAPPICLLLLALRGRLTWRIWYPLALISGAALLYTGPWDNAIILNGVWSFAPRHVLNIVIGVVPLEEYLFYVLQVVATGLLCAWLLGRSRATRP